MLIKRVAIGISIVLSLFLAGCGLTPDVPASTAPPDVNFENPPDGDLQPIDLPPLDADALEVATRAAEVQNASASATAAAAEGTGDQPPETDPAGDLPEPTAAPPEPTAAPPEPTATPEPTAAPEHETVVNCTSPYTVSKGEWFWSIGRKCNIHPADIIAANNATSPYALYPGDVINLPSDARPFPGP